MPIKHYSLIAVILCWGEPIFQFIIIIIIIVVVVVVVNFISHSLASVLGDILCSPWISFIHE